MKVIMVKKYKKYEVDQIIEVADGFGSNFLIRNGYALPVNKNTSKNLETRIENKKQQLQKEKEAALEMKEKLESIELEFFLKTTHDVVHGSITSKKVLQDLNEKGLKINKYSLPHVNINSLGITKVKVKLFDDVEAIIKINVKGEYGKK